MGIFPYICLICMQGFNVEAYNVERAFCSINEQISNIQICFLYIYFDTYMTILVVRC